MATGSSVDHKGAPASSQLNMKWCPDVVKELACLLRETVADRSPVWLMNVRMRSVGEAPTSETLSRTCTTGTRSSSHHSLPTRIAPQRPSRLLSFQASLPPRFAAKHHSQPWTAVSSVPPRAAAATANMSRC
eukprot:scaffold83273_cov30-Tisochrysis_lutea.AAC.7